MSLIYRNNCRFETSGKTGFPSFLTYDLLFNALYYFIFTVKTRAAGRLVGPRGVKSSRKTKPPKQVDEMNRYRRRRRCWREELVDRWDGDNAL